MIGTPHGTRQSMTVVAGPVLSSGTQVLGRGVEDRRKALAGQITAVSL